MKNNIMLCSIWTVIVVFLSVFTFIEISGKKAAASSADTVTIENKADNFDEVEIVEVEDVVDTVDKVVDTTKNDETKTAIKESADIKVNANEIAENETKPVDKVSEKPAIVNTEKTKTDKKETKEVGKAVNNKKDMSFTTDALIGEYMATTPLNVRKGPSTDFDTSGSLKTNIKVKVTEKSSMNQGIWYKVDNGNGVVGWASSVYLTKFKEVKPKAKAQNKAAVSNSSSSKSKSVKYAPMTFYFSGNAVKYQNGGQGNGQRIIDTTNNASTWGGASTFSGTDGLNTHFIGHSPGNFVGVQNAKEFIVTDANGTPFKYKTTTVYKTDGQSIGIKDGFNYWERQMGTGGGEKITVQTCVPGTYDTRWFIEAELVK